MTDETAATPRISGTHFPVTTLGPGRRLGIWFQGCPLACPGCMSRHTWDPAGGRSAGVPELLRLWRRAIAAGADGLTVSGGEPLAQPGALTQLLDGATAVREEATAPGGVAAGRRVDLLLYTGHTGAELATDPAWLRAVHHADALITGRFLAAEPTELVWRGSANQRLVPRTKLGWERYGPLLAATTTGRTLEVAEAPDGPGVVVYGVPRRGELAEMERLLAQTGTRLTERSWRP